jgi:hypothetical protein
MTDQTHQELHDERRRNDTLVLALMTEIKATVDSMDRRLTSHITAEEALFADAFPGGDPGGHKAWHQAEIDRIRDRAKFWRDMRDHLAKWGLIGLSGWLVYVLWDALLKGPRP